MAEATVTETAEIGNASTGPLGGKCGETTESQISVETADSIAEAVHR
jgi:hypothetical protein